MRVPELSIVTSAYNEVGNVERFLSGALQAVEILGVSAEIVFFDDGSTDGTGEAVAAFANRSVIVPIKLISRPHKMGITATIVDTYPNTSGRFVCLLPADLESLPEDDIPVLYGAIDDDIDAIVGWRKDRGDGKLLASKIYNLINFWLFGVNLHDMNWIKLIRREKLRDLRMRSDWHRFLVPILAQKRSCRFKEVVTQWHQRSYGRSNFGLKRFSIAIVDLITVKLLLAFGERPLLFFGYCAALAIATALLGKNLFGAMATTGLILTSVLLLAIGVAVEFILKTGDRDS